MFCITFGSSRRYELRQGAVTFPCILLFDLLLDKDSSRQGSRRSDWQRPSLRDCSKPLAFKEVRAIFILPARAASMSQPYKTFMRTKWRCKLGVPMLIAEDGVPSLIFAME
jgi:hypothetical protein